MKQIIAFLQDLERNNNRDWFQANKLRYDESREKMLFITELLINEIRKFDPDVPAMDARDCLFRIYRDVRFSPDKRPYKTHFGSYIARGGRKSTRAGYYFHIEPEKSFMGGGIYMPEPDVLKAIRTAIYEEPGSFSAILEDQEFKKLYGSVDGEKLKTNPKGFAPDFSHIDLLRYKSYVFTVQIETQSLLDGDFAEKAMHAFYVLHPVNKFLNDAMDNYL
jgi:uncharacterized protein (TIGR02453 family)